MWLLQCFGNVGFVRFNRNQIKPDQWENKFVPSPFLSSWRKTSHDANDITNSKNMTTQITCVGETGRRKIKLKHINISSKQLHNFITTEPLNGFWLQFIFLEAIAFYFKVQASLLDSTHILHIKALTERNMARKKLSVPEACNSGSPCHTLSTVKKGCNIYCTSLLYTQVFSPQKLWYVTKMRMCALKLYD